MTSVEVMDKRSAKLEHILEAAGKLFAYSDFQNVLMDDIAAEAQVGKGTLYNFFSSKEELYFSIIHNRMEHLLAVLEEAYDNRDDALQNLRSFIIHLHKFMAKHPHFYHIWKKEEHTLNAERNEGIALLKQRIFTLTNRIVSQGVQQKVLKKTLDKELVSHFILGMVDCLRKNESAVYEKEESIDILLNTLVHGIGAEGVTVPPRGGRQRHLPREAT